MRRTERGTCEKPNAGLDPRTQDHDRSQRQKLNHWATLVSRVFNFITELVLAQGGPGIPAAAPGDCWKPGISGPAPNLLKQTLHFNDTNDLPVCWVGEAPIYFTLRFFLLLLNNISSVLLCVHPAVASNCFISMMFIHKVLLSILPVVDTISGCCDYTKQTYLSGQVLL